jgi:sugar phosphate isomerase/epimerase
MIEAMKHSPRAYALFDLTRLVLNKPERHVVKLSRKPAADGSRTPLFLVIPSEAPFLSMDEATRYVFRRHGNLIFREVKRQIEPPKGNFQFVNRCGFTGELLGPSNYHGYTNRLIFHHKQRLAHVPFEDFKARIQTVRDEEAVKKWVESMSVIVEYECILDRPATSESTPATAEPPKEHTSPDKQATSAEPTMAPQTPVGTESSQPQPEEALAAIEPKQPEGEPQQKQPEPPKTSAAPAPTGKIFATREELEKHVIANHLSKFITSAPEVRVSGQASRRIEQGGIIEAIRLAWEAEHKFPLKTANELRPRLRREGFHFFKHHKEVTYISIIKPKRFESLIGLTDSVLRLVTFLRENDGIHRKKLIEKFFASPTPAPDAVAAVPEVTSEATANVPAPETGGTTSAATIPIPIAEPNRQSAIGNRQSEEDRLLADLHYLIMEGYVVEFSNGRLWALPDKPPQPPPAPKKEKLVAVSEAPVVEVQRPAGPAKLGVIHYNFPGFAFSEFLKFAAEAGYQYVELQLPDVWGRDVADPEQNAEKVRAEVESHGLKVSALAAHNDFVQLDREAVQVQVERMKRVCGLAQILGTNIIRTEGGQPKDSVPKERWLEAMFGCFSRCVPFLDEMQVGLAIDNHGYVTNEGDLLHALLKKVNHKLVGTNLDTMNYRWFGHDIATCNRFYEMMAPHALHTHLKDGSGSRESYKGAALGEGEINLQHALNCLWKAGYTGVYCAEYEGPEPQDGVGYRKCGEWMKKSL